MTDMQAYSFEAPQNDLLFNGQLQIGQSRLLEAHDDPNRARAYAQLHLGEVVSGAQAVVFYEQGDTTGTAVLERTAFTDGLHNWRLRTTQMTTDGPRLHEQEDATIATEDHDGFMNHHLLLKPGDTLSTVSAKESACLRTLGTIMAVHLIETPRQQQRSPALLPTEPDTALEFAKAA